MLSLPKIPTLAFGLLLLASQAAATTINETISDPTATEITADGGGDTSTGAEDATTTTTGDNPPLDLLMVGNSRFSESHNMEEMIQAMLEEHLRSNVTATRYEKDRGNMTLYAHSPDLSAVIDHAPWTWIVLQEENQIPGYCGSEGDDRSLCHKAFNASLESIGELQTQIQQHDGDTTTVLLDTWAYFKGDPRNERYFPDYNAMQNKFSHGYNLYHQHILDANPNAKVTIAPAGAAFQRVYQQLEAQGKDPLEAGSLFDQLYMPASAHNLARKYPSLAGAYLCGCVLFQTLLLQLDYLPVDSIDVRLSTFAPSGLSPEIRAQMQQVAYDTVKEWQHQQQYATQEEEVEDEVEKAFNIMETLWIVAAGFVVYGGLMATSKSSNSRRPSQLGHRISNSFYGILSVSPEEQLARELGMDWNSGNSTFGYGRGGRISLKPEVCVQVSLVGRSPDSDDQGEEGEFVQAPSSPSTRGVPLGIPLGDPEDIVDCWASSDEDKRATIQAGSQFKHENMKSIRLSDGNSSVVEDAIREMEEELNDLFHDEDIEVERDDVDLERCIVDLDGDFVSPQSKAAFAKKKKELLVDGETSSATRTPQEGGEPTVEAKNTTAKGA